jgi:hypothetical protein
MRPGELGLAGFVALTAAAVTLLLLRPAPRRVNRGQSVSALVSRETTRSPVRGLAAVSGEDAGVDLPIAGSAPPAVMPARASLPRRTERSPAPRKESVRLNQLGDFGGRR